MGRGALPRAWGAGLRSPRVSLPFPDGIALLSKRREAFEAIFGRDRRGVALGFDLEARLEIHLDATRHRDLCLA